MEIVANHKKVYLSVHCQNNSDIDFKEYNTQNPKLETNQARVPQRIDVLPSSVENDDQSISSWTFVHQNQFMVLWV